MRSTYPVHCLAAAVFCLFAAGFVRADALEKLKPEKLEATHKAVQALRVEWQKIPRLGPYVDYRANLHVHSALSHDSRGTIEEIVAAAKAAGTQVLMFTEHPSERYDFYRDGHRGMKDGVLLIPGAENKGFLIFPTQSLRGVEASSSQEYSDLVRSRGGLVFLSHLEERMDWEIRGMTGTEIYNTHADFKDEKKLIAAMRNPLWIFKSAELFMKYPQESFSALQDYPADYLKRWDELCTRAPHTGVAANDSHQNVGLVVRLVQGDKARLEDALGEKLFELDVGALPILQSMAKGKRVGDVLFQIRLDPYPISLRHVGTHLLLPELTEKAVWEALEAGRAYVSFDWLADATGFDFAAVSGKDRHEMGSRTAYENGLRLRAQAPLPVRWKVIRNGKVVSQSNGRALDSAVSEPGNYRVEAWLKIAGEEMIWVLSNPIYIRAAARG
ncbi:MAG TPA: PHP domain-containing protein [Gemmataceae bacterium]|nr:PHP domain-containing protein [Gemmataceae bacterium]